MCLCWKFIKMNLVYWYLIKSHLTGDPLSSSTVLYFSKWCRINSFLKHLSWIVHAIEDSAQNDFIWPSSSSVIPNGQLNVKQASAFAFFSISIDRNSKICLSTNSEMHSDLAELERLVVEFGRYIHLVGNFDKGSDNLDWPLVNNLMKMHIHMHACVQQINTFLLLSWQTPEGSKYLLTLIQFISLCIFDPHSRVFIAIWTSFCSYGYRDDTSLIHLCVHCLYSSRSVYS